MHVELVVPPTTKAKSNSNSKMFPVLVFLLTACYGIMALVVIEQGHVIQSQRNLIQQLFQDSQQLAGLKTQVAAQQAIDKKRAKTGTGSTQEKTGTSSAAPAAKEQAQRLLSRKSKVEKQPLQADDKVDRRRFPSQI